ncbi:hypothetical protein Drose_06255 [Dactylosporangium roseum]|uniref:Uncharacterized protein n=1 Tax=Dactylosporangium roseum TaxID=47989 RepID=A0ABY5ZC12_9ACTN|nr:hypothetical protein [Dactylosporangium roseum]UWZ37874.1 hypothetical protein Drose_06255 [Dactylosporangium roseum]
MNLIYGWLNTTRDGDRIVIADEHDAHIIAVQMDAFIDMCRVGAVTAGPEGDIVVAATYRYQPVGVDPNGKLLVFQRVESWTPPT